MLIIRKADGFGNTGGADGEDWEQEVCCGRTAKRASCSYTQGCGSGGKLLTPDAASGEEPVGTHERGRERDRADKEGKSSADAFHIHWEGFCLFWEC